MASGEEGVTAAKNERHPSSCPRGLIAGVGCLAPSIARHRWSSRCVPLPVVHTVCCCDFSKIVLVHLCAINLLLLLHKVCWTSCVQSL